MMWWLFCLSDNRIGLVRGDNWWLASSFLLCLSIYLFPSIALVLRCSGLVDSVQPYKNDLMRLMCKQNNLFRFSYFYYRLVIAAQFENEALLKRNVPGSLDNSHESAVFIIEFLFLLWLLSIWPFVVLESDCVEQHRKYCARRIRFSGGFGKISRTLHNFVIEV